MQMHHIHLMVPDPFQAQKWYMEHFGATTGKRAQFEVANVPGTEITLGKTDTPQAPTKGRSVDHMGFRAPPLGCGATPAGVRHYHATLRSRAARRA
jgi:catechol 2,3-dioxygenase-like lactoylglutathione lyase family enzyme